MKIITIVVTYNRLKLLKEGLEAIRKQTAPIEKIVVVDNGCTDGTTDWLKEQENLTLIHQENIGGAGGFKTGIKYAFENGADWIWVMDDDVKPEPDCLAELLKYGDISKCLHPKRMFSDGNNCLWANHLDIERNRLYPLSVSAYDKKALYFINTGCFEGMLIHSDIVKKIGFPDSRFFICGDDTIYGYLANHHTNVCCVNSAVMMRAAKSTADKSRPLQMYYGFRNYHLFEEYSIKLTQKNFDFRTRLEFYLRALNTVRSIIVKKNSMESKIILIKAVMKGVWDSKQKKVNKSF